MNQWDTSSSDGMNIVVHVPSGLQIAFAVLDVESGALTDRFGFDVGQPLEQPPRHPLHRDLGVGTVVRARDHGDSCQCASFDLAVGGGLYRLQAADHQGFLLWRIHPLRSPAVPTMSFAVVSLPSRTDHHYRITDEVVSVTARDLTGVIHFDFSLRDYGTFTSRANMFRYLGKTRRLNFSLGSRGILCVRLPENKPVCLSACVKTAKSGMGGDGKALVRKVEEVWTGQHKEYCSRRLGGTPENVDDCARALMDCLYWNTCRREGTGSRVSLINREWVQMMETVCGLPRGAAEDMLVFNWDSAFNILLACWEAPQLAEDNLWTTLESQQESGRVPQVRIGSFVSDRSNPPVLALAAWKLYRTTGKTSILKKAYPAFRNWYRWFEGNRRGPDDILWAWGTDRNHEGCAPGLVVSGMAGAWYESGMDDSPVWDAIPFDPATGRLSAACVDLSALMVVFARILHCMAVELGEDTEAARYQEEFETEAIRLEQWLWDERFSFYFPRFPDGRWVHIPAVTGFYPLLAGTPSRGRAATLIKENFFNPDRFGGDFMLPTIARTMTAYDPDGDYWRGRIWPPANYLVFLGLREYDIGAAHNLAENSSELLLREWRGQGHVHENYSALTGYGEPQPGVYARSCPYYTWGGLMGLMLLEELFDVELFSRGIRFGAPYLRSPASVDNMLYHGRVHGVVVGREETELTCEGKTVFHSRPGCLVRRFDLREQSLGFIVEQGLPAHIELRTPVPSERVKVTAGGGAVAVVLVRRDCIAFNLVPGQEKVMVEW